MTVPAISILAQDVEAPRPPDGPAPGGFGTMLPMMILMMVIFYFVLIRPQRRQQKELERKRESLRLGDDVITIGGIHGRVTAKSSRTVTVKVSDNTRIKFEKTAITQVFPNEKGKQREAEDDVEEEEEEDDSSETSRN